MLGLCWATPGYVGIGVCLTAPFDSWAAVATRDIPLVNFWSCKLWKNGGYSFQPASIFYIYIYVCVDIYICNLLYLSMFF